jgi:hypothetical protein
MLRNTSYEGCLTDSEVAPGWRPEPCFGRHPDSLLKRSLAQYGQNARQHKHKIFSIEGKSVRFAFFAAGLQVSDIRVP